MKTQFTQKYENTAYVEMKTQFTQKYENTAYAEI